MSTDPTQPEVTVTIGGEARQLRWDKRALFRLGDPAHADAQGRVSAKNHAALFRRACIYGFCMLLDREAFVSAEDLASALQEGELEKLMDGINQAILAGQPKEKGEAADPLSGNGPSRAEGSA